MRYRPHQRLSSFLRLLVLAWIALGVVAQPLMASLGDLHEASHDAASRSAHAHGHADHGDHEVASAPGQESPKHLHDLLHLTHCCGQSPAGALPAFAVPAFVALPSTLAMFSPSISHDIRRGNPFRPPIAA